MGFLSLNTQDLPLNTDRRFLLLILGVGLLVRLGSSLRNARHWAHDC